MNKGHVDRQGIDPLPVQRLSLSLISSVSGLHPLCVEDAVPDFGFDQSLLLFLFGLLDCLLDFGFLSRCQIWRISHSLEPPFCTKFVVVNHS